MYILKKLSTKVKTSFPQNISTWWKKDEFSAQITLCISFFILLFLGLFLGDGKQAIIDVYMAGAILFLYGLAWALKIPDKSPSQPVLYSWWALLGYFVVRTLFSDSIGLSVYVTMRMIGAYLVFCLFVRISSPKIIEVVKTCLLMFVSGACLLSIYYFFFPPKTGDMMFMSLVYANYGHNHLSALLVFILPLFEEKIQKFTFSSKLIFFSIYFGFLFWTFSRGAWAVMCLYFVYRLVVLRKEAIVSRLPYILGLGVFLWALGGLLFLGLMSKTAIKTVFPTSLQRFVLKPTLADDGRLDYWHQAWVGFTERPILGSGPGTFELTSRRLQGKKQIFSWFAHNYYLELLTELGGFGFGLMGFLYWIIYKKTENKQEKLLESSLLLFILACYDFQFSYYLIIILLFVSLGLLQKQKIVSKHFSLFIPIFTIAFFYFLSLLSMLFSVSKNSQLAMSFMPFNKALVLIAMNENNFKSATWIIRLYKNDSQIHTALLTCCSKSFSDNELFYLYSKTLLEDPTNKQIIDNYLKFSQNTHNPFFEERSKKEVMKAFRCCVEVQANLDLIHSLVIPNEDWEIFINTQNFPLGISKILYLTGLQYVNKDPEKTKELFNLSSNLSDNWGTYRLELASLYVHTFHDKTEATNVLNDCKENRFSKKECDAFTLETLPPVGAFRNKIILIDKK